MNDKNARELHRFVFTRLMRWVIAFTMLTFVVIIVWAHYDPQNALAQKFVSAMLVGFLIGAVVVGQAVGEYAKKSFKWEYPEHRPQKE